MAITEKPIQTDRNLALELVRVTEAAALAASRWIGLGKKNEADGAAVEAMRKAFDAVAIDGTVVIGEGEMDEAPMLYHRREGRRRRPDDGYRRRSAGGHHADRQGRARTRSPRRAGRARQFSARAGHLHGQDRRRRRACRTGVVRPRRVGREPICATWRGRSDATSPTWWPASWTVTATRN